MGAKSEPLHCAKDLELRVGCGYVMSPESMPKCVAARFLSLALPDCRNLRLLDATVSCAQSGPSPAFWTRFGCERRTGRRRLRHQLQKLAARARQPRQFQVQHNTLPAHAFWIDLRRNIRFTCGAVAADPTRYAAASPSPFLSD